MHKTVADDNVIVRAPAYDAPVVIIICRIGVDAVGNSRCVVNVGCGTFNFQPFDDNMVNIGGYGYTGSAVVLDLRGVAGKVFECKTACLSAA